MRAFQVILSYNLPMNSHFTDQRAIATFGPWHLVSLWWHKFTSIPSMKAISPSKKKVTSYIRTRIQAVICSINLSKVTTEAALWRPSVYNDVAIYRSMLVLYGEAKSLSVVLLTHATWKASISAMRWPL